MKIFIKHLNSKDKFLEDEISINVDELNSLENAVCDSIDLNNLLDYVEFDKRNHILKIAINKLKYGGIIKINGIDLMSLSKNYINGMLEIEDVNNLIKDRKSSDNINSLVRLIQGNLIEIKRAKLDGYYYYIEAQRPKYEKH